MYVMWGQFTECIVSGIDFCTYMRETNDFGNENRSKYRGNTEFWGHRDGEN